MRASEQDGSYPRPQLVRADWTCLDGTWEFGFDDDDRGRLEHWYRDRGLPLSIEVPFVFESSASGIGDHDLHPVVWYRRSVDRSCTRGRREILHFGAVDQAADVWVDGQHVGFHGGGQTAFSFDITDALAPGTHHTITVRAFDDPNDGEVPRGKQDWRPDPHFIWYRRSTGIWKTVWLESVPEQHLRTVDWSCALERGAVECDLRLARQPAARTMIEIELWHGEELLAGVDVRADGAHVTAALFPPVLRHPQEAARLRWSPEHPALLDAHLTVRVDGEIVDVVDSYLGLRSLQTDSGVFSLNGRPYRLRSVLEQGYWPDSQLTAPTPTAWRREVELIKELGFNTARVHQKVEDARFLYWADRLGLMIWAETAAAYEFSPAAVGALVTEWAEVVAQCRNHPSVITWVPANESWGVPALAERADQRAYLRSLADLTRALDPTRPVISNDGWEHVDSDLLTVHDYATDPESIIRRYADVAAVAATVDGRGPQGRRIQLDDRSTGPGLLPVMITEFGGIACAADGTWGYAVVSDDEQFRDRLTALFDAVRSSPELSGFCYTQLTDTLQESNGLLTADRRPKLPIELLRAIVTGADQPAK